MHLSAPRPRTDTTFTRRTPRTRERRVANVHGNAPAPSPQTRKPTTLTTRDAHPPCHGDYVEMPRFPLESHTRAHHTHTRTQRFNATADCLDPSHSHKSTHCIGKAKRTLQPFCLVAARGRQPIALSGQTDNASSARKHGRVLRQPALRLWSGARRVAQRLRTSLSWTLSFCTPKLELAIFLASRSNLQRQTCRTQQVAGSAEGAAQRV